MQDRVIWRLLGAIAALHMVFAIWPQIDILFSRQFVQADGQFWLTGNDVAEYLRALVWTASLFVAFAACAMLVCTLWLGAAAGSSWRIWAFVSAVYIVGPGLLVNALLKEHWGRARPMDITAFGGTKDFTPPFEMANQCLKNCSFVSGEAAATAVLAIMLGVLLARHRPTRSRNLWWLGCVILFAASALQRVGAGRHFLSDVVFAGLFMLVIARMFYLLFRVPATNAPDLFGAARADLDMALQPAFVLARNLVVVARRRLAKADRSDVVPVRSR